MTNPKLPNDPLKIIIHLKYKRIEIFNQSSIDNDSEDNNQSLDAKESM